jgi:hypothetical protein
MIGILFTPNGFAYTSSTYTDPQKEYSIEYPSTWIVDETYLDQNTVRFYDDEDWSVFVQIQNQGSIWGIENQSDDDRTVGMYGAESISCKLSTFENDGYICYDIVPNQFNWKEMPSGEFAYIIAYHSMRQYDPISKVEFPITTVVLDFTKDSHVWSLIIDVDSSEIGLYQNEIKGMGDSFKFLNSSSVEDVYEPITEPITEPEKPKIPAWVNNTMQWYLDGVISEDEMITAIQYLVKEGIIDIS